MMSLRFRSSQGALAVARHFGSETAIPTALSDYHKSLGGKMVPFAGYSLPVLYETEKGGVVNEHLHTRGEGGAGLFDVSHMGQVQSLAFFVTIIKRYRTTS